MLKGDMLFVASTAGIYFFFIVFGVVQEKINKTPYGPEREYFTFTAFLIMVQAAVNALVALTWWRVSDPKRVDRTPIQNHVFIGFFSIAAMYCSNLALHYVDYPTQALGKSCKPISVLFVGVLFRRKFTAAKYASIFLVVVGVSYFMLAGSSSKHGGSGETSLLGLGLLLGSLVCDGLVAEGQNSTIDMYSPMWYHMMTFANAVSVAVLLFVVAVTGEGLPAITFCMQHPDILVDIAVFSMTAAFGQIFIYIMVRNFSPIVLSTVTTTRKFFTILASVAYYGHTILFEQWVGVATVFVGLAIDVIVSKMGKKEGEGSSKKDSETAGSSSLHGKLP